MIGCICLSRHRFILVQTRLVLGMSALLTDDGANGGQNGGENSHILCEPIAALIAMRDVFEGMVVWSVDVKFST